MSRSSSDAFTPMLVALAILLVLAGAAALFAEARPATVVGARDFTRECAPSPDSGMTSHLGDFLQADGGYDRCACWAAPRGTP